MVPGFLTWVTREMLLSKLEAHKERDQAKMEHKRYALDLWLELQRKLARAEVLMFIVSDGDPLSDVGCSPLFHSGCTGGGS